MNQADPVFSLGPGVVLSKPMVYRAGVSGPVTVTLSSSTEATRGGTPRISRSHA